MIKPFNPHSSIGRLQLAQRVYQVLVREIDHAIEVERLLTDARYARDVLLVCDALVGSEAPSLAAQFRMMPLPMPAAAAAGIGARGQASAPGHAQQATEWARDTSGFGVTQPPQVAPVAGARPRTAEPTAGRSNSAARQRFTWLARWRDLR
ncbi:MAG: hypothetical protein H7242_13300 [Microbacteriaceae bacterium]|nr:hypothetical protein [Burkholderiaceae bacterium]